jgi:oxygen-dependent protoporphyrinogen oxidase
MLRSSTDWPTLSQGLWEIPIMSVSIGIIGAGVSGLTVAYRLKTMLEQSDIEHDLTVYEKSNRTGGSMGSDHVEGFLTEWGPNGFLNNEPATFELIHDLGIRDRLVVSSDAARKRYLYINRQLHQIPLAPPGFLKTPILPLTAKLRFALEPLIPKRNDGDDESVADFVTRRFGRMAVERMFDPLMSGIYAGNVNTLSIHSTLKVFSELEREHGSVVRGMIARVRQRRKAESAPDAPPKVDELLTTSKSPMTGKLLSFENGMIELVEALTARIAPCLRMSVSIRSIQRIDGGYRICGRDASGEFQHKHDIVVLATPPTGAAMLLRPFDSALGQALSEIQSSTIAVLALGFRDDDITNPLDGFGYLIPRKQAVRSLGVLWSSSIFPNRAPQGHKLLQIMIGGAHDMAAVVADDELLIRTALSDADPVLGFRGEPVMARVFRHGNGIPQYSLGHRARLEVIQKRLETLPGLYLAGNGYHGISSNDCIRHAGLLASKIVDTMR